MNQTKGKQPIDEAMRQALLDEIQRRFGVKLLWYRQCAFSGYRHDVTVHGFFDPEDMLTDELKRDVRRWLGEQEWQLSRQMDPVPGDDSQRIEHFYLAPMIPVALAVGYHATRRVSLLSIKKKGLLPSSPDRQTTERWDCEGNIYLCENLGKPADAGMRGTKSANWWRAELAKNNRFNDPDFVILRVKVGKVEEARIFRDIWSESGVIVDNVLQIPPHLIRLVHPRRV